MKIEPTNKLVCSQCDSNEPVTVYWTGIFPEGTEAGK